MSVQSPAAIRTKSATSHWWFDLRRDLPLAFRGLRRTPGFSLLCILTIAVGIGANAAIFSVINAVLIKPLPYGEPDRLVRIWESLKDQRDWKGSVSVPNLEDWRAQSHSIENFVAYNYAERILDGGNEPERILGLEASANIFNTLHAAPLRGRVFAANEDQPGSNRVVVLSERFWRRRFGGDTTIVGRSIILSGLSHTVIGIMPESFAFPSNYSNNDVWLPYTPRELEKTTRGSHSLSVIARIKPGFSLTNATEDLKNVAAIIEKQFPASQANRTVAVSPLQESMVGSIKPALFVLLGSVALVLLIACANVANLLLARAESRRRDVAVRLALGASRSQLIRQYLTESVILALSGAIVGAFGAWVSLKPLTVLSQNALPLGKPITLDMPVLLFLLTVSIVCGIVFGLAPALQTSSTELRNDLTGSGGKTTSTKAQQRVRGALVVAQIALSLILLINAGLMMRAFVTLRETDSGIAVDRLISIRLSIPKQLADSVLAQQVYHPVLDEVRGTAGVRNAGMISMLPIDNWGTNGSFWVDGKPKPDPGKQPITELRQLSPGYFATMGIKIKDGRDFLESDNGGGVHLVMINQAMAREHFPGVSPIGKALRFGDDDDSRYTIIGVVGDVRSGGLERKATPETYFPYTTAGMGFGNLILVVRTTAPLDGMITSLRKAVHKAAPNVPVYAVRSMDEIVGRSLGARKLNLTLLSIFASIALILAASGLYGVISYLVAQRTREIGIRMALGADRARVVRMVVMQGIRLASVGIAVGLIGSLALTRVLSSMLYGVGSRDPGTFAGVPLILATVAFLATLVPAWRASQVDPMHAIRSE
ncbi:MAG: ABC transporter permease [Gemmatimonadaceae bacterium]